MGIESRFIWMDGKLVPYEQAQIHVLSHTLHYGLGVFEGIRCYQQDNGRGGVYKLREHLRRLFDSAKMCQFEIPYTLDEIADACLETLASLCPEEHGTSFRCMACADKHRDAVTKGCGT